MGISVVNAQGLVGGLDSGGAAEDGFSSVLCGLSDDVLSSTLFYEYENEYGQITAVKGAVVGDVMLKRTPDDKLLIKISAEDVASGTVITIASPDGKLLESQSLIVPEVVISLPSSGIIIVKVDVKGKGAKVIKISR